MRYTASAVLSVVLFSACCTRRPAYVTVPQKQFRSAEPAALPLEPQDRDQLLAFFSHGGNRYARGEVSDDAAKEHRRALDALADPRNLSVRTNRPARDFCDMAVILCGQTALFHNRRVVQQVVDARDDRPPFPAPLAVTDGHYWWIFRHSHGVLTGVVVVREVQRQTAEKTP